MKTVWKVLVGLAVVVPMGAYVAGALAASATSEPAPRQTIEIQAPDPTPSSTPSSTPSPSGHDEDHADDDDDDDVEVITPYDDLDDDADDQSGHGRDGSDDDGGHGDED